MKNTLKILLVLLLLLLGSQAFSQQYWLSMNSPVKLHLKRACFLDSNNGWICGDSGLIMKTTNGGQNWIRQNTKVNYLIHDIFFINKRLGWALSWNIFNPNPPYGTFVLKTTDGGANWDTTHFPSENVYIRTVYFQDSLYGFMGGTFRNIMRTTDGGANWLDVQIDSLLVMYFPVNNFTFYNNNYGYASGGQMDFAGVVWRTTDRGVRWTPALVAAEPTWNVHFLDSLRVIGMTGDFEYGPSLINTTNAGASWKYFYLGLFGFPSEMAYRTIYDAWAPLGFSQKFMHSIDSGYTWVEVETPDSAVVNHVLFTDSLHGYAVCEDGKILKYNSAVIGIGNNTSEVPDKFLLNQNYPNPFNPLTNITYVLKSNSYVMLDIYDINGRFVRKLFDGYQNSGKYKLRFDGGNLSSGVYFYRITVRDLTGKSNEFVTETKKMLLVK